MNLNITLLLMIAEIVSLVLILLAISHLYKAKSIPGAKLMLASALGAIFTIFIPENDIKPGEVELATQSIEVIVNSFLMLMASYGFYIFSRFTARNCANNTLKQGST